MTTGQTLSIIVAIIISAIVVTFTIVSNQPKTIVVHQTNDGTTAPESVEQIKKFNLKDIINSITKNKNA